MAIHDTIGWCQPIQRPLFVGFDYENVLVERIQLTDRLQFIDYLRGNGVSKPELEAGILKSRTLWKLDLDLPIMNRLKDLADNPLWTLADTLASRMPALPPGQEEAKAKSWWKFWRRG